MPRLAPRLIPIAAALVALLSLGACQSQIDAPTNVGVCYHLAAIQDGKAKFNVVASNVPDMEHCAAHLEAMRTHFLSLGGTITDIVGAYQGNFLFLSDQGVFTSATYQGGRYPFLVRNGDQLVPVGSAP